SRIYLVVTPRKGIIYRFLLSDRIDELSVSGIASRTEISAHKSGMVGVLSRPDTLHPFLMGIEGGPFCIHPLLVLPGGRLHFHLVFLCPLLVQEPYIFYPFGIFPYTLGRDQ